MPPDLYAYRILWETLILQVFVALQLLTLYLYYYLSTNILVMSRSSLPWRLLHFVASFPIHHMLISSWVSPSPKGPSWSLSSPTSSPLQWTSRLFHISNSHVDALDLVITHNWSTTKLWNSNNYSTAPNILGSTIQLFLSLVLGFRSQQGNQFLNASAYSLSNNPLMSWLDFFSYSTP